ncbi:MAG: hypothetical protein CMH15_17805 [Mesonia sp.]|nr:hypothetical protein [Mesonia sp.]
MRVENRRPGFGHGAGAGQVGGDAGQVDGFAHRVVGSQVAQDRRRCISHALLQQAQQLGAVEAGLVERVERAHVGGDEPVGFLGQGLGPERHLPLGIEGHEAGRADDVEMPFDQLLRQRGAGEGTCEQHGRKRGGDKGLSGMADHIDLPCSIL